MPTPKQMEKLATARAPVVSEPAPDMAPPDAWWDSVLSDPRAAGKPWLPISQRRLSEIPRHLLRVECLRCIALLRFREPTRSSFLVRMRFIGRLPNDCLMTPADTEAAGLRKMVAGRNGWGRERSVERSIQSWARSSTDGSSSGLRADGGDNSNCSGDGAGLVTSHSMRWLDQPR
jgi:hypothetical protein